MAPTKKTKRPVAAPSSELGTGDWATDYNSKGRAIRKCRTTRKTSDSLFEDSAIAVSDTDLDDVEDEDSESSEVVTVAPVRKRRRARSPSPAMRVPPDVDDGMMSDSTMSELMPASSVPIKAGHMTVNLTVNIPTGHQGPITLHLDPKDYLAYTAPTNGKPDRLAQSTLARLNARSKTKKKSKFAGFLELPAELRNEIYRAVLVASKPLEFSEPDNFSRSSALLRTCHQIHEEGRSILYSENHFRLARRAHRYGSFWEKEWSELGYLHVRKFFKSIGPTNSALIRHLTLMLEDAMPCLNPTLHSAEDRRFVHDDDLMSVLRHLVDHSQLQTLKLHFYGRRKVDRTDDRFLEYLKRVKADEVSFITWPPESNWHPRESKQDRRVEESLLLCCTRKKKKFDSSED